MSTLRVSTAICTWNRASSLERTLLSMTAVRIPAGVEWELIVVNNACTDDTDAVIDSFKDRLPLRRLYEMTPGLANARNRAITEASSEYIVWTDDDVLVEPTWLEAYCAAFRLHPRAQVFGGPIEPLFEGEPPSWLPLVLDRIGWIYGRQSFGEARVRLSPDNVDDGPYGANMALRVDALRTRRFDTRLGVRGNEYSTGEETQMLRGILEDGGEGWWIPEARVRHRIPASSQTTGYIRRWMIGRGRAATVVGAESVPGRRIPRLWLRIARHEVSYRILRIVGRPEGWIGHLLITSYTRGRLKAARTHVQNGRSQP